MSLSCGCDDEVCEVWVETRRKARKQHECDEGECGEPIAVGEVYVEIRWVFDGHAGTARRCLACHGLCEDMAWLGYCVPLGELRTCLSEMEWDDDD